MLSAVSTFLSTEFEVVDCALNGAQALEATLRLQPDILVLDIGMPGSNGFETARELQRADSRAKVIFLTGLEDFHFIAAAMDLGYSGFVFKTSLYIDLPLAIHAALEGRTFFSTKRCAQSAHE